LGIRQAVPTPWGRRSKPTKNSRTRYSCRGFGWNIAPPPPHKGELAPGQGPPSWGAKMACPGREKVMGANFAWGANFACGRGIQSIIDVSYRILVRMCPVHLVDHSLRSTKARHPSRRALKFAPGFKQFWGEPFRPFPSFRPLRAYAGVRTRRRPLVDEPPPQPEEFPRLRCR